MCREKKRPTPYGFDLGVVHRCLIHKMKELLDNVFGAVSFTDSVLTKHMNTSKRNVCVSYRTQNNVERINLLGTELAYLIEK